MVRMIVCLEMPATRKTVPQKVNLRPPTLAGVETSGKVDVSDRLVGVDMISGVWWQVF